MKFDANIAPSFLAGTAGLARRAEQTGFAALWTSETKHNPFLPLSLVAANTDRIRFGTAIAVAFARSPTDLAYQAWDLAGASHGRFILGLGSQVKSHIERRFGMEWPESPLEKMEEIIAAIRAIWRAWSTGDRLHHRGKYFRLSLMTPFFSPGPMDHPEIPIFLAGVNPGMCQLAGKVADGLHGHPFHTARYLREVVRPAIAAGAAQSDRAMSEVELSVTVFVVRDERERRAVCEQIAFYASTPTYRPMLDLHGWGAVGERLSDLARAGRWDEMGDLIGDEMLEQIAVVAAGANLAPALRKRYSGLVDRINLYLPFELGDDRTDWSGLVEGLRA